MLERKLFIIGLLAFAAITLFNVSKVMAFSNEPCSQSNYEHCSEPPMVAESDGWRVVLNSITPKEGEPGKYVWDYTFANPTGEGIAGSNFIGILFPDCCNSSEKLNPAFIENSDPAMTCFEVGEGETTIYFGKYINQAFVCKGTPDSTGSYKIIANTKYKTTSTIIIKLGKIVIDFEMAVPGCPPAPAPIEPLIGSRTFTECSNFGQDTIKDYYIDDILIPAESDDVSFYVIRNSDREGCVAQIWQCRAHNCPPCTPEAGCDTTVLDDSDPPQPVCTAIDAAALPTSVVTETSFTRTCPDENISVKQGSPVYLYTINSGGRTFEVCLDLLTYQYIPVSECK